MMSKLFRGSIALASLLIVLWLGALLVVWLGRWRMAAAPWHGYCKIADGYPLVGLIVVGEDVYYDKNSDHVPQPNELIPDSRRLDVPSLDGGASITLEDIKIVFAPIAVSDEQPQFIWLEVQSLEHPEIRQAGEIITAREVDAAGTCHLLGPLSFQFCFPDIKLEPGAETMMKISIGTAVDPPTASSYGVINRALVYASAPGDRSTYAFDKSQRPKMEISFNGSAETETIIVDGFC